jgi:hypothetical protein
MNKHSSRNTALEDEGLSTQTDRYIYGSCDGMLDNHHLTSQIDRVAEAFRVGTAGFDPCSLHRVTKR